MQAETLPKHNIINVYESSMAHIHYVGAGTVPQIMYLDRAKVDRGHFLPAKRGPGG